MLTHLNRYIPALLGWYMESVTILADVDQVYSGVLTTNKCLGVTCMIATSQKMRTDSM